MSDDSRSDGTGPGDLHSDDGANADDAASAEPSVVGHLVLDAIAAAVPGAVFEERRGQWVALVEPAELLPLAEAAKDQGFESCMDVTAVDYLRRRPRFEVVVNLLSREHRLRLRVLAGVPAAEPVVPSLTGVYPGANFFEREVFDMFGIRFEGHEDLTRILMPDDWEGHPLRKDYPVGSVPVQFKSSRKAT